jgi:carbon storage regulator CsrA
MFVIMRRPGEAIVIELPTREQFEVEVLSVKGNQVKLGTYAPEELLVLRKELLEDSVNLH